MPNFPSSLSTNGNLYIAVNGLETALASSVGVSDMTIPLSSTTGFPSTGFVTLDTGLTNSEVIQYTGISGANLTGVTRGADGTTASAHVAGAIAGLTVVAAHHNLLKDEIIAIETALGIGFVVLAPSPVTNDLLAWNGSAWVNVQNPPQLLSLSGGTMTGILNMGSHKITNVMDPVSAQDAATKNYVDTGLAGKQAPISAGEGIAITSNTVKRKASYQSLAASGSALNPDASVAENFDVTVTANTTINGPINGYDMQAVKIRVNNDASHSLSLATGAGNFSFNNDVTTYTATASKIDYIGCIWDAAANRWHVVSIIHGA